MMNTFFKTTLLSTLVGSTLIACTGGSSQVATNGSDKESGFGHKAAVASCAGAWSSGVAYIGGQSVSVNGENYVANWWTTGSNPATNNGAIGTGKPWTLTGACTSGTSTTPTTTPATTPTTTSGSGASTSITPTGTTTSNSATGCDSAWSASATYTAGQTASYGGLNYIANWWTQNNNPSTHSGANGSGMVWTEISSCGGTATTPTTPTNPTTPTPPTTPSTPVIAMPGNTTGAVNFHLLLGVSGWNAAQDQINLTGGNYNDLIMSNIIAGVMYGHLIQEYTPGMQFNKDYLYGSIMGQLLQENIATEYYVNTSNLIDPSPDQQAVMGAGQGGPYQINNYAADMVSGTYTPAGHSLINYVAIQKNIGYSMASAGTQYTKPTPASFNNKYYGPVVTAFFHYNDYVSLIVTGTGTGGWVTPWQPQYDNALNNFKALPNNFLDILLNTAYNQGYYGGLVSSYSTLGASATTSTLTKVNAYSSVWGINDTYEQYPYQVRYYLDQLYDNPIPTTSATTFATPTNHVAFNMTPLETVFGNVVETLAYVNTSGQYNYITSAQAQTAFNSAMNSAGVTSATTLDLSNASDRAKIFAILENAIGNLENNLNMKLNATTSAQL